MGQLIVTEFVTLDGVAQAPGRPDEDRDDGFAFGGWQAPLFDEEAGQVMFEQAQHMDALLLGRRTYDIFADYWPSAPEDIPFTALLNGVPKYVATTSLSDPLLWRGASVLDQDLTRGVAELKDRHEQVHVIGSLQLVQSLLTAGLVDRLNLWVHPVLLGTGKRALGDGTIPAALSLDSSATYPSGTSNLVYSLRGAPAFGDMTTV